MAQVEVLINGRAYKVACDDGEEEHLLNLADYLDRKVMDLTKTVGQVGETRLILMASLVIADELAETMDKLEATNETAATASAGSEGASLAYADVASDALSTVAKRIEDIAAGLENT